MTGMQPFMLSLLQSFSAAGCSRDVRRARPGNLVPAIRSPSEALKKRLSTGPCSNVRSYVVAQRHIRDHRTGWKAGCREGELGRQRCRCVCCVFPPDVLNDGGSQARSSAAEGGVQRSSPS